MENILQTIISQDNLVEIQLADGTKVQGHICAATDDQLTILQADGTTVAVSADQLAHATYFYAGRPRRQADRHVPTPVRPNGRIASYGANGIGFVEPTDGSGRVLLHADSFLIDDELKAMAAQQPAQLVGKEVLIVKQPMGVVTKAYLLRAGTLDEALDSIAVLAADGRKELAANFCRLLLGQQPGDADLTAFLDKLTAPPEEDPEELDFYKPIAPAELPPQWTAKLWLTPQGRIKDMGPKFGKIIDVRSHQELFVFREQLMGSLRGLTPAQLIGRPVVYSISRANTGQGYQARSIMAPMKYTDAYDLAEDMHYDDFYTLGLNAADVLRIIIAQHDDPDYEETLGEWRQNRTVAGGLWQTVTPPPYTGQPERLVLNPRERPAGIIISRATTHTDTLPGPPLPPLPPVILIGREQQASYAPPKEERQDTDALLPPTDDEPMPESTPESRKAKRLEQAKELERGRNKDQRITAIGIYRAEMNRDTTGADERAEYVRRIMQIYSDLLRSSPDDDDVLDAYQSFGKKYLGNYKNNMADTNAAIDFYYLMDDRPHLIAAYEARLRLLEADSDMDPDARLTAMAQTKAEMAWTLIQAGQDLRRAEKLTREALADDNQPGSLARTCNAMLRYDEGADMETVRTNINFEKLSLKAHREWLSDYTYSAHSGLSDKPAIGLIVERYALLNRLVYTRPDTPDSQWHWFLARYVATLGADSDSQYYRMLFAVDRKNDWQVKLWLVEQLGNCVQKGPDWSHWNDLRVLAMLSTDAAYHLCTLLGELSPELTESVMLQADASVNTPGELTPLLRFAQTFEVWRGENYKMMYEAFRERFIKNTFGGGSWDQRLDRCLDNFQDLKMERWMQQDDRELVTLMHLQMPGLIIDFLRANNSRDIITARDNFEKKLEQWNDYITRRPTVLLQTVFSKKEMYDRIIPAINEKFRASKKGFLAPEPLFRIISTSMADADGSLLIELEMKNAHKWAYPMKNVMLQALGTSTLTIKEQPHTYGDESNVYGDEKLVYLIHARLSDSGLKQQQATLRLKYEYSHNDQRAGDIIVMDVAVTKWTKDTPMIENVYSVGTVAMDSNQFYGREGLVAEVVSNIDTPSNMSHYYIYGQKRSGKSSVLYHIRQRLAALDRYICVDMIFLNFTVTCEGSIYYEMLLKIKSTIERKYNRAAAKAGRQQLPGIEMPQGQNVSYNEFCDIMEDIKDSIRQTPGWEGYKLVLFIDEFTSTYKWYKQGLIDKGFFSRWRGLQTINLFSAVLIGQDVLRYIVKDLVPNDFAGYTLKKLDYLQPEDALRLATEPIVHASGNPDFFVGQAAERILDYSACSAYYTKWICHELLEYVKSNHLSCITEADVEESIRRALRGSSPELLILFDPLEYSGQDPVESAYSKDQTRDILHQIAVGEQNDSVNGCPRSLIVSESVDVDLILDELTERGVIIRDNNNHYQLRVKLYLLWTLQTA